MLYAMPGYLPDSHANVLQVVISKAFKLGYLSSVLNRQLFNKLNTNPSIVPSTLWKLHARFSLPQSKTKLFKDAYLNRVLFHVLFFYRRALYNFANVNFYVNNWNVCIAVAIKISLNRLNI